MKNRFRKVLVIGSGPIIIGQAAEFDYSGTQSCQVLREEGIETVLVNSNPATIMTDLETADHIYIEPLTLEFMVKIIEKERPDAILPGMGGQTALNLVLELADAGILDTYHVTVLGTPVASIKRGEDRELFRQAMKDMNQPVIESDIVTTLDGGIRFANRVGYPIVVRPAYTLGGTGGGIAENEVELLEILSQGLTMSRVGQVLVEKSIKGWKEIEYEVMRDKDGNAITVCNMENIDPVGVHTGDSIVVAPSQTLSDKEYQMLRTASLKIIDEIGIVGGCNVQLALHPTSFEYAVIEINPRVSRSSALASKATGYPIAKVSTKLALGYRLDEIENAVTKKTTACFEPSLDYVVVKIPKWPFDKFRFAKKNLGTKMMATGEVMAIANSFEAALLKAIRSLENKNVGLFNEVTAKRTTEDLRARVQTPDDERIFELAELIRRGFNLEQLCKITGMDMFFMKKIESIVEIELSLREKHLNSLSKEEFRGLKKLGFDNVQIAKQLGVPVKQVETRLEELNIRPVYKMVDTCAGEFEASSPYYYSTYDEFDEVEVSDRDKVIVIGSGPIRIGQGIEFDYCSVHGVMALKELGFETIIINNNPETVSTDFDVADKLYFEPLTTEDVMHIINKEKPLGVILQFGGQTAIKLAKDLEARGVTILGTTSSQIDLAEDREKFEALLESLSIPRPMGVAVRNVEDGLKSLEKLTFPLLVRPSYVLGGQGMEIVGSRDELKQYLESSFERDPNASVLIDQYIMGREIEVDCITDGTSVLFPGIMEHLEQAGVHSGDSVSIYPNVHLSQSVEDQIVEIGTKIAQSMGCVGLLNIQCIVMDETVYIIEVNPRASRTIPYLSKVTNIPMISIATKAMFGHKIKDMNYGTGLKKKTPYFATKVPVFSTNKLPGVEVSLGPEMRSTGEVLGVGMSYVESLAKGFVGAGMTLLREGQSILITLNKEDRKLLPKLVPYLLENKLKIYATPGTARTLNEYGIETKVVKKIHQGIPNIIDTVRSGELSLVVNTPTKAGDAKREGFRIRRAAVEANVPVITSLDTFEGMLLVLHTKPTMEVYDLREITKLV